jgi:hypothetical protein
MNKEELFDRMEVLVYLAYMKKGYIKTFIHETGFAEDFVRTVFKEMVEHNQLFLTVHDGYALKMSTRLLKTLIKDFRMKLLDAMTYAEQKPHPLSFLSSRE